MYELLPAYLARSRVVDGWVMAEVIEDAMRRCGVARMDEDLRHRLRGWYLWRLGDRLFRHEALEWVASWAKQTGRTFRIYGNGWDKHPTLSGFAAGSVDNGRDLLCVYRASKINLQLMPAGFIHQRALDGLAGGGFFLGRMIPDELRGRTLRQLDQRIRELGLSTTDALLACGDASLQALLRAYLGDRFEDLGRDPYDRLSLIRVNAELLYPDEVFPDFREIVFDSADEFACVAERFLADDSRRLEIAERMRQVVIDRFSYRSTMDQFLRAMGTYLHEAARKS
jgi:hypothetical protein